MNICKAAAAAPSGVPDPGQLEQINRYARAPLTAEDVYVFSVRLCDDQPDRDLERFDTAALPVLAELFRGKTGVLDHDWSAEKQCARIFDTEIRTEGAATALIAWCYCLRSEEELVAQIDAGIKKEVSVGCSMGSTTCSVCGSPYGSCEHKKGETYAGEICYAILGDPKDAYEFSFVAVPAQREAGVNKQFGPAPDATLLALASLGREYLDELKRDVTRLALTLDLGVEAPVLRSIADQLEPPQLKALKQAFSSRAAERFPGGCQLTAEPAPGLEPEYRI